MRIISKIYMYDDINKNKKIKILYILPNYYNTSLSDKIKNKLKIKKTFFLDIYIYKYDKINNLWYCDFTDIPDHNGIYYITGKATDNQNDFPKIIYHKK